MRSQRRSLRARIGALPTEGRPQLVRVDSTPSSWQRFQRALGAVSVKPAARSQARFSPATGYPALTPSVASLRLPLGFDHPDKALASRAHTVGGFETLGPLQTQRDHRGRVDRHAEARGQALSAKVARMFLEELDHGFAEI